jgi:hypothetical protein
MGLAPVHPDKQHGVLLCSDVLSLSERRTCGALMAVLTWHDIPPAVRPPQHQLGHALPRELQAPMPPNAHRLMAPPKPPTGDSCGPIRPLPPDPPPPRAARGSALRSVGDGLGVRRCQRNVTEPEQARRAAWRTDRNSPSRVLALLLRFAPVASRLERNARLAGRRHRVTRLLCAVKQGDHATSVDVFLGLVDGWMILSPPRHERGASDGVDERVGKPTSPRAGAPLV